MTDAEIIARLGGLSIVAVFCGVSTENARHWANGRQPIPWKYRKVVARLAKEKRVKLPGDFLHERRQARAA